MWDALLLAFVVLDGTVYIRLWADLCRCRLSGIPESGLAGQIGRQVPAQRWCARFAVHQLVLQQAYV